MKKRCLLACSIILGLLLSGCPMNTMIPQQVTGSERASEKALAAPCKPPFLWGVATSGYQVEGFNNPSEDHTQWATWPVVTPVDEATGFYTQNKYLEDVALAGNSGYRSSLGQPFEGLHAKAFRISIDWARVQPTRDAPFDFSFYVGLINKIREEGMEPVVTLLHSTYPGWLKDELGWDKPGQLFPPRLPPAVKLYLNFVQAAVNQFNDSVRYWITFTSPTPGCSWAGWLASRRPA
jgi:beta-glucosidase